MGSADHPQPNSQPGSKAPVRYGLTPAPVHEHFHPSSGAASSSMKNSQGDTSPESRAHSRRRSVRQLACKWGDPAAAGRAPGFQLPAFVFDLPASVPGCPASVLGCPTSALGCPASVVNPPPFPQNPPLLIPSSPFLAPEPLLGAQAAHSFLRAPLFWRRAPSSGCGAAKTSRAGKTTCASVRRYGPDPGTMGASDPAEGSKCLPGGTLGSSGPDEVGS